MRLLETWTARVALLCARRRSTQHRGLSSSTVVRSSKGHAPPSQPTTDDCVSPYRGTMPYLLVRLVRALNIPHGPDLIASHDTSGLGWAISLDFLHGDGISSNQGKAEAVCALHVSWSQRHGIHTHPGEVLPMNHSCHTTAWQCTWATCLGDIIQGVPNTIASDPREPWYPMWHTRA